MNMAHRKATVQSGVSGMQKATIGQVQSMQYMSCKTKVQIENYLGALTG